MSCKLPKKFIKIKKKKETLPSFLLNLSPLPVEISFTSKLKKTDFYSGPLFFDACDIYHHPQHHFAQFDIHKFDYPVIHPSEQFSNLFLSLRNDQIQKPPSPSLNILKKKNPKPILDPYFHRCPGTRKIFKFEAIPRVIAFGKTKSNLETEICEEIPFCRYGYSLLNVPKKFKKMSLSDPKNKSKTLMTPEERAAHLHFPKRFRTVELIGPRIPASFTITKIPSKRKRLFEFDFTISSTAFKKASKESEKKPRQSSASARSSKHIKEKAEKEPRQSGASARSSKHFKEKAEGQESFSTQIILDRTVEDKRKSGASTADTTVEGKRKSGASAAGKHETQKENVENERKGNLKTEGRISRSDRQNTITFKDLIDTNDQSKVVVADKNDKPNFLEMQRKKKFRLESF